MSNRWEPERHPDPSGGQLAKLKTLRDCLVIYDFCRVLPAYQDAGFTVEADRAVITTLLLGHLKQRLSPRKEHQEYLGEWRSVPWTDHELTMAFTGQLPIPPPPQRAVARFRPYVPRTIGQAVERSYGVERMSIGDLTNPQLGVLRSWGSD